MSEHIQNVQSREAGAARLGMEMRGDTFIAPLQSAMKIQQHLSSVGTNMSLRAIERGREHLELFAECTAALAGAKTAADVSEVIEKCVKGELELMIEDGKRLSADNQALMEIGSAAFAEMMQSNPMPLKAVT